MRVVCRVNLEFEGFRVLEADTTDAALRLLDDGGAAAVVTDLKLAIHGDGLQFARQVRERYPNVGLVVMTGTTPRPDEPLDFADAVLTKPFDLTAFIEAVRRAASEPLKR